MKKICPIHGIEYESEEVVLFGSRYETPCPLCEKPNATESETLIAVHEKESSISRMRDESAVIEMDGTDRRGR